MFEKIKSRLPTRKPDRITGLTLESSSVCNLRCPHCMLRTYEEKIERGTMSPDTVKAVVPYLQGLEEIDLTGWGEPLLNKQFFHNLETIRQATRAHITMTTNGLLLDEQGIERILENRLHSICFSVDACREESYRAIRPGGDFRKLEMIIKNLADARNSSGSAEPKLYATYLLRRERLSSLGAFLDWAGSLGLDGVVLQQLTAVFNSQGREQVCYEGYYGATLGNGEKGSIEAALSRSEKGFAVLPPETVHSAGRGACGAFNMSKPFITFAGDVTVCCAMAYPTLLMKRDGRIERKTVKTFGNVNTEPLDRIFAKPEYRRLRDSMRQGLGPAECEDCIGLYLTISSKGE